MSMICWLDDIKATSDEKLPYLDAKTLRGKSDKNYITSGKVIESGTKIILVDGENSGEVFVVPFRGYMGSTFKILGASKNIHIDYLNIVLDFYRDIFKGNKIGAAIPHLNKTLFKSLLIGLPPLKEQKRIVTEAERYKPLIAEYDKLEQQKSKLDSEIYDRLKKSILQYAIQGKLVPQDENDEPASELLKRIRAEKKEQLGKKYVDSYIYKGDDNCYYEHIDGKEVDITEEIPFDLPYGWEWKRLNDLFFVTKLAGFEYTNYFTKSAISRNNSVPIVRAQNVKMNKFIENEQEAITLDLSMRLQRSALIKDCLLMTFIGAGIGDVCKYIAYKRQHLAPNVAKMEPYSSDINLDYCLYWLMSPIGQQCVSNIKKMTAQPSLSMETIRSIFIAMPPLAEQQRIVNKINEIFAKL